MDRNLLFKGGPLDGQHKMVADDLNQYEYEEPVNPNIQDHNGFVPEVYTIKKHIYVRLGSVMYHQFKLPVKEQPVIHLIDEMIAENQKGFGSRFPDSETDTTKICWTCFEDQVCVHEIRIECLEELKEKIKRQTNG